VQTHYEVNPTEADIVRAIFALVAEERLTLQDTELTSCAIGALAAPVCTRVCERPRINEGHSST
jgi:hypothetical protein